MHVSEHAYFREYDKDSQIVWSSLFGRPMLLSAEFANRLRQTYPYPFSLENMFGKDPDPEVEEAIAALTEAHILIASDQAEQDDLHSIYTFHNGADCKNKIKSLSLIMSERCQFRCKYCIHFASTRHSDSARKTMPEHIAKTSIDGYFSAIRANGCDEAYINFGGGEPLLNWKTIKPLLSYIEEYREKVGIPIKLGINTNLGLLTGEIAEELIRHQVNIAASLDGTKQGNDSVRLNRDLTGTYEKIMQGFEIMSRLGRPLDGFAMTVTKDNFFDVDQPIIDWAASLGMKEVRIDIDVVGTVDIPVPDIVQALTEVRRYARAKGISVIGFWSRPAENMGLIPEVEDVGFCGAERGNSICVAPSGRVFPCGYSSYMLGSYTRIADIYSRAPYHLLIQSRDLSQHAAPCGYKNCPILGFCRGGCMVTREAGDSAKLSRMCELYIGMTYEILKESIEG